MAPTAVLAASESLGGVAGWAVGVMDALGAPGAGLIVALENIFPPLPSEVVLPLAGFAAAQGAFSLLSAVVWTTVGSLVGALVAYGLGFWLGRDRIRALFARIPLLEVADVDRAEHWFGRYGALSVFLGRMVPVVRSLISVPAGVERMSLPLFVLLTGLGSALWNTAFVLGGYLLGARWQRLESAAGWFSNAVIGLLVVALVALLGRRALAAARSRRHEESP